MRGSLFNEGLKHIDEFSRDKIVYPEELPDKKCGGCVRCKKRNHVYNGKKAERYHCMCQPYDKDITPEDKACSLWWDKAEHERIEEYNRQAEEDRRKELWAIYAEKEPIKLPIVHDGYGFIPECPICGEMPYSTEQCHWCGQRFIQDKEIEEYNKPETGTMDCFKCGGKGTVKYTKSKYNGHKHGHCTKCGMKFME